MAVQENNWYRLDNAAKLFPAVSTVTATNVFRLTCRLYEDVSQETLQKAVEQALDETPSFKVRLRKGVFWYYFEQNTNTPKVTEEHSYPCRKLDKYTNNAYLFDVTYCGKYINVEFFHALCDGTGAAAFFSKIITSYLILAHENELPPVLESVDSGVSHPAMNEDSFVRITRKGNVKGENMVRESAYNSSSTLTQNGEIKVIKGIMSVNQLKSFAKAKNATITEALAGVLIYSLYNESFRYEPVNRSIDVCIPVNLRKFFPSDTIRNFFTTIGAGVNFYEKEYTLDEIIAKVSQDMRGELTPEKIYPKIMYCVNAQKNLALRFVPLFLKNLALRITFAKGEKGFSLVLSNLGQFNIPKEIEPYVERFEFLLSPTLNSRYKTSACSFKDTFVYSFTTNIENTEVQRKFFAILREHGIDVTISCNSTEVDKGTDALQKSIDRKQLKSDKKALRKQNKLDRRASKKQNKLDRRALKKQRRSDKKSAKKRGDSE